MQRGEMRLFAVDWSGARVAAQRRIWLAEVRGGALVRLEDGRSREQLGDFLLAEAERDPRLVVGLDFAFSLPSWFLAERGVRGAPELWGCIEREGERLLAECRPPFWGRPGLRRPALAEHLRATERPGSVNLPARKYAMLADSANWSRIG